MIVMTSLRVTAPSGFQAHAVELRPGSVLTSSRRFFIIRLDSCHPSSVSLPLYGLWYSSRTGPISHTLLQTAYVRLKSSIHVLASRRGACLGRFRKYHRESVTVTLSILFDPATERGNANSKGSHLIIPRRELLRVRPV